MSKILPEIFEGQEAASILVKTINDGFDVLTSRVDMSTRKTIRKDDIHVQNIPLILVRILVDPIV